MYGLRSGGLWSREVKGIWECGGDVASEGKVRVKWTGRVD